MCKKLHCFISFVVKKFKSKTPAQDRLQKLIDMLNKTETINRCTTGVTYIIPDTNVFLESLDAIKRVIDKGQ